MLRNLNSLVGYAIHAADGDLGKVDDFYFDDQTWTIRYIVVATGSWLSGRRVLLSPVALGEHDWDARTLRANLTMEQVRNSPDIDTARPVSRQHEVELSGYYAWPMYWGSGFSMGGMYGAAALGPLMYEKVDAENDGSAPESHDDPHLRSARNVAGYHIAATDGDIGHVEDYIVDDQSWGLRFLVVTTRNWLPGRRVLISPHWIKRVDWSETKVLLDLSQEAVKGSPEFDPSQPITADYDGQLHDYYGRPRGGASPPSAPCCGDESGPHTQ